MFNFEQEHNQKVLYEVAASRKSFRNQIKLCSTDYPRFVPFLTSTHVIVRLCFSKIAKVSTVIQIEFVR